MKVKVKTKNRGRLGQNKLWTYTARERTWQKRAACGSQYGVNLDAAPPGVVTSTHVPVTSDQFSCDFSSSTMRNP